MTESKPHLTTSSTVTTAEHGRSLRLRWVRRNSLLREEAGKRYGRWTVLNLPLSLDDKTPVFWVTCECSPDAPVQRRLYDMKDGRSKGCRRCKTTEGYKDIPKRPRQQLQVRYNRIQGATNPNSTNKAFAAYRKAGIENRFTSAEDFVVYMYALEPHDDYSGLEVDRKDNTGHYEKGNLRFVTREENAQNRAVNTRVTWQGERMSAHKFCRVAGLRFHPSSVIEMLRNGATPEQIIQHQKQKVPGVTSHRRKPSMTL